MRTMISLLNYREKLYKEAHVTEDRVYWEELEKTADAIIARCMIDPEYHKLVKQWLKEVLDE